MNGAESSHLKRVTFSCHWSWASVQAWDTLTGEAGPQEEGACDNTPRIHKGFPSFPKGACSHSLREQLCIEQGEHPDTAKIDRHRVQVDIDTGCPKPY